MQRTNLLSTNKLKSILFTFLCLFSGSYAQANDCLNIDYSWGNGAIDIEGLTAPIEIIDIYDGNWNLIFHCDGTDCGNEVNLTGLSPDDYHIKIQSYSAAWEFICRRDWDITIYAGSSNPDLALDNLRDYASEMEQGSVQTFKFDLKNIGTAPANDIYTIKAYLTPNRGTSANDIPLGEIVTGNINIGTIPDVVGAITVPFDFPLGFYYLILRIEVPGFGDLDYNNNFVVTDERIEIIASDGGGGGGGAGIQCGEIAIRYGNGIIAMNGQSGNNYFFKIHDLNNGWAEAFSCSSNCGDKQTATLPNGKYLVRVYNSGWSLICEQEIDLSDNGGGGACGQDGDLDGDDICNEIDNCRNTYNPDQADSDGNGIGDACQTNQEASQLICPENIVIETNDPSGIIVTWDDPIIIRGTVCGAADLTQRSGPVKGSKFPIGETNILYTAFDLGSPAVCQNTIACNFDIIVKYTGGGGNTIQCGEISLNYTNNSIEMNGQSGENYFFKVHDLNNNWAEVFSCSYQCGSNQTASNLSNNTYLVKIFNDNWNLVCEQEINLGAGNRNAPTNLETFTLFPNPAQSEISVDLKEYAGENAQININNIYGQIIYQQKIENLPTEALKIQLSDFVNGLYLVNIRLKNRLLKSEKFMVKRLY